MALGITQDLGKILNKWTLPVDSPHLSFSNPLQSIICPHCLGGSEPLTEVHLHRQNCHLSHLPPYLLCKVSFPQMSFWVTGLIHAKMLNFLVYWYIVLTIPDDKLAFQQGSSRDTVPYTKEPFSCGISELKVGPWSKHHGADKMFRTLEINSHKKFCLYVDNWQEVVRSCYDLMGHTA